MSEARKCDICGEFFVLPNTEWYCVSRPFWSRIHFMNSTEDEWDLCRHCTDELEEWINSMKAAHEEKNND